MTDKEKAVYRKRYQKLMKELDKLTQDYSCGIELAGFINPRVKEVKDELDRLIADIEKEMQRDKAVL